jgi:hypothetical protein
MRGAEHLIRIAAVFIAGTLVLLGIRAYLVPHSFGRYGHYRADSLGEIAALPIGYAGHAACETCHSDEAAAKSKGKHAGVGCEACHGALARHADDFAANVPQKPDPTVLCAQCHEASAAKPKWFAQVATADHSGGVPCNACHQPHNPTEAPTEAKAGGTK